MKHLKYKDCLTLRKLGYKFSNSDFVWYQVKGIVGLDVAYRREIKGKKNCRVIVACPSTDDLLSKIPKTNSIKISEMYDFYTGTRKEFAGYCVTYMNERYTKYDFLGATLKKAVFDLLCHLRQ